MSRFVLIPRNIYDLYVVQNWNNQNPIEESIVPDQNTYKKTKLEILENSKHKSQLIPFIPDPIPLTDPRRGVEEDVGSGGGLVDEEEAVAGFGTSETNRLLKDIPLTGLKLKRAKLILTKFNENPRLSLSNTDTVVLEGVDTGLQLANLIYRLQTSKNLAQLEKDIAKILKLQSQHTPKWVTIN